MESNKPLPLDAMDRHGVMAEHRRRQAQPRRVMYQGNWTELLRRKDAREKLRLQGYPIPAANIGRKHPHYGMTPAEHWAAKAAGLR